MADERFLNDSNVSALWNTIKEYINNNTATISGGLTIELDPDIFGEPPYTLEFTEEIEETEESEE